MQFLNFRSSDGVQRVGLLAGDHVLDLGAAAAATPEPALTLATLCQWNAVEGERLRRRVLDSPSGLRLADVRVLPPVLAPRKFLGVGGNFRSHIREAEKMGAKVPPHPVWFNKQVSCLSGPFDPILRPIDSEQLDYEGELGLVIARRCRRVSVADALSVVAGCVVVNDVSVRDWQMRAPTATVGKSFDSHGPVGPCLVTLDEIGQLSNLRIRTWVNGELRQDGNTNEMIFDCARLISDITTRCTLEPGDILSIGSPAGVGGLMDPPRFLVAGDVVRVEVERVGVIENRVVNEEAPHA